jgi:hypothetical protein
MQRRKEQIMKRLFQYLNDHLATVLSVSLAMMFSSSIFALVEGFNRLV